MKKFGIVVLFLIDIVITSFCTVWMWNSIVAAFFNIPHITIMQGWAITVAVTYFIKGHGEIGSRKERDWIQVFAYDIIYTLLIWLLAFIIIIFAF